MLLKIKLEALFRPLIKSKINFFFILLNCCHWLLGRCVLDTLDNIEETRPTHNVLSTYNVLEEK